MVGEQQHERARRPGERFHELALERVEYSRAIASERGSSGPIWCPLLSKSSR